MKKRKAKYTLCIRMRRQRDENFTIEKPKTHMRALIRRLRFDPFLRYRPYFYYFFFFGTEKT